jgi:hypothetical protein
MMRNVKKYDKWYAQWEKDGKRHMQCAARNVGGANGTPREVGPRDEL